jgi:hypothetical protein
MPKQTRYVTVDLVIKGNGETEHLTSFLEAKDYFVQKHDWNDGNKWYLNISCPRDFDHPDLCIRKYCEDLSSLPDEAKEEWEHATFREISIGYHTGAEPRCFESHVSGDTVIMASQLHAGIGIVMYPAPEEE